MTTAVRLVPPQARWNEVRSDLVWFGAGGLVVGLVASTVNSPVEAVPQRLLPYAAALVLGPALLAVRRLGPARFRATRRVPVLVLATVFVVLASAPVAIGGGPVVGTAFGRRRRRRHERLLRTDEVPPGCRHVAFWIAALSERQLYYGSWVYTAESLSAYPQMSTDYQRGPAPRPDRLDLSLRAVRAPTPAVIAQLRKHGVSWIEQANNDRSRESLPGC